MDGQQAAWAARRLFGATGRWLLSALLVVVLLSASASAADCLRPQDELFLISTRGIGGCWLPNAWQHVACHRYATVEGQASRRWLAAPIEEFVAGDASRITVVYVHGNRVRPGEDIADTLSVYRALLRCTPHAPPLRLVAFSWPTERIAGPLHDYRLKAELADPTGLHLASVLAHLPSDNRLALVGYSYGARVICGALHVLAGGTICGYGLPEPARLQPAHVLLVSAAVHNDWLLPGRPHGMAMKMIDRLVLINNSCDPALRFYHLSSRRGRPYALGRWGVAGVGLLGEASARIVAFDACNQVGKRHALQYYLSATSLMHAASQRILPPDEILADHAPDDRLSERTVGTASRPGHSGG